MTTITNNKLTDERVSNATLIRLIQWADQHNSHYVAAALCELQERRKADSADPAGYHVIKECGKVGCSVATLEEAEKTRDFWNKKWIIKPYFYAPPVQETGVYKDMLNIIDLLEKNEWAEHCTNTVLGSLLESEITRLVSKEQSVPVVPDVLERLRIIVSDPRALPRRKEWISGQQYSYVLLENVEAMVEEACRAAMLKTEPATAPVISPDLHPDTQKLVTDFCTALTEKLYKAQLKYGYDADWKKDNWSTQCLSHFHQHIAKGDPRDVAAYCAFMWYHGWKTESVSGPVVPDEWTIQDAVKFCRETGRQDAGSAMDAWNACRSAMLNGGKS